MITSVLLIGSLLIGQTDGPADAPSQSEVRGWVRQLDADQLADRDAAEARLLQCGPAVLDLLPTVTEHTPAEVAQRLLRVRQQLQQIAADAATDASRITLHGNDVPLSKVLAAFERQSGNRIIDCRARFGQPATEPRLRIDFQRTPFWPALDAMLKQAGMKTFLDLGQRAVGVIDAPPDRAPNAASAGCVCYRGPFRFEPVRVQARGDRRGPLRVVMQAAWEPRIRIVYLLHRMADVTATEDGGKPLNLAEREAQLDISISGNVPAVEWTIPFRLPDQQVAKIAELKGKLTAVMLGKMETFRFTNLAAAKNVSQRIAETTVTVEQVRKDAAGWEVFVRVRFDRAFDALASHRTWIFDNEAALDGPDGKPIRHASYETTLQTENEVGVAYRFRVDRPLAGMAFVYRAPGAIVSKEFDYELRGIRLPRE